MSSSDTSLATSISVFTSDGSDFLEVRKGATKTLLDVWEINPEAILALSTDSLHGISATGAGDIDRLDPPFHLFESFVPALDGPKQQHGLHHNWSACQ